MFILLYLMWYDMLSKHFSHSQFNCVDRGKIPSKNSTRIVSFLFYFTFLYFTSNLVEFFCELLCVVFLRCSCYRFCRLWNKNKTLNIYTRNLWWKNEQNHWSCQARIFLRFFYHNKTAPHFFTTTSDIQSRIATISVSHAKNSWACKNDFYCACKLIKIAKSFKF